jgi:Holliday junction resolvasome RuvABC endonuclease subunit
VRGIGLNFQKGRIRVSVLERDSNNTISFHSGQAVAVDPQLPIPELMERYAAQIRIQIDEFQPQLVAARQVWDAGNVDGAMCQVAPFAIAGYVCNEKGVPFRHYTPQALSQPARFGLAKGTKPIEVVDQTFGTHPPYWDDMQRGSVLVVWRALLDE